MCHAEAEMTSLAAVHVRMLLTEMQHSQIYIKQKYSEALRLEMLSTKAQSRNVLVSWSTSLVFAR